MRGTSFIFSVAGLAGGAVLALLATAGSAQEPYTPTEPPRRQIFVRLPVGRPAPAGRMVVQPNVEVMPAPAEGAFGDSAAPSGRTLLTPVPEPDAFPEFAAPLPEPTSWTTPSSRVVPSATFKEPQRSPELLPVDHVPHAFEAMPHHLPSEQFLPVPEHTTELYEIPPDSEFLPAADPLFESLIGDPWTAEAAGCRGCGRHGSKGKPGKCKQCDPHWEPWHRLFDLGIKWKTGDIGIGHERVMHAPFEIDTTQPFDNIRLRYDSVHGVPTPDRAEFFWAAFPRGPLLPEVGLDYQDIRFMLEVGDARASVQTELPLRFVDPVINDNTGGLGDMNVAAKLLIIDGRYWQIGHIFRTYINTGSAPRGLGTGHLSLEPGLLARYLWTPSTYLHGELKYWFPIGGDPLHSGDVLRYGFGISHVLYETDTFAALPTLEFVGWSVLSGMKTVPVVLPAPVDGLPAPVIGVPVPVDGETFGSLHTGMRFVLGPEGDLGLFELGVSTGLGLGRHAWYRHMVRVDLRWSF